MKMYSIFIGYMFKDFSDQLLVLGLSCISYISLENPPKNNSSHGTGTATMSFLIFFVDIFSMHWWTFTIQSDGVPFV